MRKYLSKLFYFSSQFCVNWLLILLVGCYGYDLPERQFPICDQTPIQLNTEANLLDVNFTLLSNVTSIDKVDWFFGDGKQLTTTSLATNHTFQNPGKYKVNVTITNICGDVITLTKDIAVNNVTAPTVVTEDPSNIGISTATVRIAINDNGNDLINVYGICYSSINSTPTIESDPVIKLEGNLKNNTPASFSLKSLAPNQTLYVRGFATNSAGTGYGNVKAFRTLASPTVTTLDVISVGKNEATVRLKLIEAGNPPATHVGFIYSPTNSSLFFSSTDKQYIQVPAVPVGGTTSIKLSLKPKTSYFYRAFAINAIDTTYGDVSKLTTLSEF